MRDKATKKQMTIKEFSELSGIPTYTLRHWDEYGIFKPSYRDQDNNYRYYSPLQFISVKFVSALINLDIPLRTIRHLTDARTPEQISLLIKQQGRIINRKIQHLHESSLLLHTRGELIHQGLSAQKDPRITVRYQDEMSYFLGPPTEFAPGGSFHGPFITFCEWAKERNLNTNFPIGGRHDSLETYINCPSAPDNFFTINPISKHTRPAGKYLVGYSRGFYGVFGDLPQQLQRYTEEHKLKTTGPLYVIYLLDETCMDDTSQYLSQVCIKIAD
ncbi:MerR family transcriptional regulator [Candidatus Saccharibacteria bacterium]|nr:MerR family transcriptional regulator [Candidatus Saccharibacteria bacterium]